MKNSNSCFSDMTQAIFETSWSITVMCCGTVEEGEHSDSCIIIELLLCVFMGYSVIIRCIFTMCRDQTKRGSIPSKTFELRHFTASLRHCPNLFFCIIFQLFY